MKLTGPVRKESKMKKKESWIVVTNKASYLLLVVCVLAVLKIFFVDLKTPWNVAGVGVSLFIIALFGYLFVRMNSYNELLNPNHPHPDYAEEKQGKSEE